MAKIKITCDSTCDLTPALYEKYGVEVLPLQISMGERVCPDGAQLPAEALFDFVRTSGALPQTSAVSVGAYEEVFRRCAAEGCEVVHINISSELSSCWQNACIAAEEVGGVYPVDSRSLSSGSGLLVIAAAEMAAAGMEASAIAERLTALRERLDVSFVLQTLEYLHKGGRCSGVAALGANLLRLRPEIVVEDGKMTVGRKYRGTAQKTVLEYIRGRLENNPDVDTGRIMLTYAAVPAALVAEAEALVRRLHEFREVLVTTAGSTISSHCGPGCLGVLFFRKEN